MSTLFEGFKHKYPIDFLGALAKLTGSKVVELEPPMIASIKIEVKPMGKPLDKLYYADMVLEKE